MVGHLWLIGVVVVFCAIAVVLIVFTIIRFNQLSMARSLCDEAKRQLTLDLRARHQLVPPFVGTLQQITGTDQSNLELALASAQRAAFGYRGAAAENALTRAIDAAAQPSVALASGIGSRSVQTPNLDAGVGGPDTGSFGGESFGATAESLSATEGQGAQVSGGGAHDARSSVIHDELDTTVQLLHGQLVVTAERIMAAARLYNTNVKRYHRQRLRLLSRPFGGIFRDREYFTESGGTVES